MSKKRQFNSFLESVKQSDKSLVESIQKVYNICFENESPTEIIRHYSITYNVISEESAEHGDYAESGWFEKGGWKYANDPATGAQEAPEPEIVTADPEFDENIVDEMVKVLRNAGATQNNGNDSYSTSDADIDFESGDSTYYTYHLLDFTPEELDAIASKVR